MSASLRVKNFQFILAPDNTTPLSQIFIGEKPCNRVHAEYHFVSDIAFVIEEEEDSGHVSRKN